MASSSDNISMAVFCDFENVALGVRDANYEKFDIKPVLERLLLKGSIVVKKAYCDWERYKGFKATMHEANFELIEIPHVRQSGKNSADIRLVVDALDLCYTKSHVNTFVIISGDSDFSPLVSKLRENNKQVIGVGVKQSTSDLLVANCDEFIFYDDLVREIKRAAAKRDERKVAPPAKRSPDEGNRRKEELEARKAQAIDLVVEMFDALVSERGDSGKIWASLLKDTLKRRRPDFNETYYGFRTFGNLLEEAQNRGMLEFGRDEKSGAYVYRSSNSNNNAAANHAQAAEQAPVPLEASEVAEVADEATGRQDSSRRRGRGGRNRNDVVEAIAPEPVEQTDTETDAEPVAVAAWYDPVPQVQDEVAEEVQEQAQEQVQAKPESSRRRGRGGRNRNDVAEAVAPEPVEQAEAEPVAAAPAWYDPVPQVQDEPEAEAEVAPEPVAEVREKRSPARNARKAAAKKSAKHLDVPADVAAPEAVPAEAPAEAEKPAKPARKSVARSRREAKPKVLSDNS